ncbi:flavin reductase family protein [Streptomyces mirabilis]|uniref:flavin reductase family protein n=1 Tax=Streptomyces mirabilis TaxID=68239 RepID=UPI0033C46687
MDAITMRHVLGHFGSGVTVITGLTTAGPVGFTCQSFFSLSLDPALVTFAPSRTSTSWPGIRPLASFAINILADHQTAHSTGFSRSGTDKFSGVDWRPSNFGAPVLAEALAHLDCRFWAEYDGGDHTIVAAEVMDFQVNDERAPLLFYKGAYASVGSILPHAEPVAPTAVQ